MKIGKVVIANKALYTYLFFLSFYLILGYFHEQWRDEGQAYMLAKDSSSFVELFENLRYEGHPPLWHILLRVASWSGLPGPMLLTILQAMIAAGTATLWFLYFPLPLLYRIAGLFSYFFLFEYGVIARSYSLGCLLWLVALLAQNEHIRRGSAVLLAFTSIYGWVLSLMFLVRETLYERKRWFLKAVYFLCLGGALLLTIPSKEQDFFHPKYFSAWPTWSEMMTLFTRFFSVYAPVSFKWPFYWEDQEATRIPNIFFGLLFVISFVLLIRKTRFATVVVLLLGFALFASISLGIYSGGFRHNGHWFLLILGVIVWDREWIKRRSRMILLGLILCMQALGGLRYGIQDLVSPFSGGKEAAAIIKKISPNNELPIVGGIDFTASAVAHYLEKPIYYLNRGEWGTFVKWDKKRKRTDEEIRKDLAQWLERGGAIVLLDPNYVEKFKDLLPEFHKPMRTADARFILDETYSIWVLSKKE